MVAGLPSVVVVHRVCSSAVAASTAAVWLTAGLILMYPPSSPRANFRVPISCIINCAIMYHHVPSLTTVLPLPLIHIISEYALRSLLLSYHTYDALPVVYAYTVHHSGISSYIDEAIVNCSTCGVQRHSRCLALHRYCTHPSTSCHSFSSLLLCALM